MNTATHPKRGLRPTSFLAQKFLAGVCYPAEKARIVEAARSRGADPRLLQVLSALPERRYDSPVALAVAIGNAR